MAVGDPPHSSRYRAGTWTRYFRPTESGLPVRAMCRVNPRSMSVHTRRGLSRRGYPATEEPVRNGPETSGHVLYVEPNTGVMKVAVRASWPDGYLDTRLFPRARRRFLAIRPATAAERKPAEIQVVVNWTQKLTELHPFREQPQKRIAAEFHQCGGGVRPLINHHLFYFQQLTPWRKTCIYPRRKEARENENETDGAITGGGWIPICPTPFFNRSESWYARLLRASPCCRSLPASMPWARICLGRRLS